MPGLAEDLRESGEERRRLRLGAGGDAQVVRDADVPHEDAAVEQAAIQASCETRRLVGQQAQAFTAAALPLCRPV